MEHGAAPNLSVQLGRYTALRSLNTPYQYYQY